MQRWSGRFKPATTLWRLLATCAAAMAGVAATVIAAMLAIFFAATMVVVAFMASLLLALTATAVRTRRRVRAQAADSKLIEARNVGGHSWVAYGWDGRR